jgi:hypothetical protein
MVAISAEELHWLKGNISALQARHSEAEKSPIDSGDTAWLLTSSAFGKGSHHALMFYLSYFM